MISEPAKEPSIGNEAECQRLGHPAARSEGSSRPRRPPRDEDSAENRGCSDKLLGCPRAFLHASPNNFALFLNTVESKLN